MAEAASVSQGFEESLSRCGVLALTSGIEVCRQIRDRFPLVKVLILTSFADIQALMAAVMARAVGYVLKQARSDDLVDTIRRVSRGESLLDPDETRKLLASWQREPPDLLVARLSSQERAILNLIAVGLTNREIAGEMSLAEKTVKNYVSNLLTKMGMRRRSEAAAYKARLDARKTPAYPPETSSDAD
jgi:two-component system, NarL family, response regulator DevR